MLCMVATLDGSGNFVKYVPAYPGTVYIYKQGVTITQDATFTDPSHDVDVYVAHTGAVKGDGTDVLLYVTDTLATHGINVRRIATDPPGLRLVCYPQDSSVGIVP